LSIAEWERVFEDAATLGVERLDISGGEPSLYRQLPELVRLGRSFRWQVNINTNGTLMSPSRIQVLLDAGLNSVYVSLYGSTPQLHDEIRHQKGLWDRATGALRHFSSLGASYVEFSVKTQSLMCRTNFRELPWLIRLSQQLGAQETAISYLEGDFLGKLQLTPADIHSFREEVIPNCLAVIADLHLGIREKDKAMNDVRQLFSSRLSVEQWASSTYQADEVIRCDRPSWFSIILANGDVHPCNMVEYTHTPIMGNVKNVSLKDIWESAIFELFRDQRFDFCRLCPINLYTVIPLR
jgi:pyrroloquinoline quinone biosynthesis protein E